jgi:hypothetical protein
MSAPAAEWRAVVAQLTGPPSTRDTCLAILDADARALVDSLDDAGQQDLLDWLHAKEQARR